LEDHSRKDEAMTERLELIGPWFWSKKQKKFVDWETIQKEDKEEKVVDNALALVY